MLNSQEWEDLNKRASEKIRALKPITQEELSREIRPVLTEPVVTSAMLKEMTARAYEKIRQLPPFDFSGLHKK